MWAIKSLINAWIAEVGLECLLIGALVDGNAALQASEISGCLFMMVGLRAWWLILLSSEEALDRLSPGGLLAHALICGWWWRVGLYVCMYVCMHACMHACNVCMYVCMHVCMYVRMYVCMYGCMYVCMHASM